MNFCFLLLCSFYVMGVLWQGFDGWGSGSRQWFAAPPGRSPAAVLTEDYSTQSMKSVDSRDQGPVWWALLSPTVPGRKERLSQHTRASGAMKR